MPRQGAQVPSQRRSAKPFCQGEVGAMGLGQKAPLFRTNGEGILAKALRKRPSADVKIFPAKYNDIWVRDTLPTFAVDYGNSLVAINWHFNGWGRSRRTRYDLDLRIGREVALKAGAITIDSDLVAEGGAFWFDGRDLIVATESTMRDPRRNPKRTRKDLQSALLRASQCSSICWLPGEQVSTNSFDHWE